jgi:hypothetical protein
MEIFYELKLSLSPLFNFLMTLISLSSETRPNPLSKPWLLVILVTEINRKKEIQMLIQLTFWNSDLMDKSNNSSKDPTKSISYSDSLVDASFSGTFSSISSPNSTMHTKSEQSLLKFCTKKTVTMNQCWSIACT